MTNENNKWNIAVVENDLKFLNNIVKTLKQNPNIGEIVPYESAELFLRDADNIKNKFRLALFDIKLKDMDGIALVEEARVINKQLNIIMLTTLSSEENIFASLRAGAVGYLWKSELEDLNMEIDKVIKGGATATPTIAAKILEYFRKPLQEDPKLLTTREKQVLEVLATGVTTQKASETLHVSNETLRTHVKNIYQKLEVHNRIGMIKKAGDIGII
ncbi:MAG: response regulator transcription factor [Leptospirales bacterium]